MRLTSIFFSMCLASCSAAPEGSLLGVFRILGTPTLTCEVAEVFFNGTNVTYPTTVCDGLQQTYPAFTAFDPSTNALVLVAATASDIFSIDRDTHLSTKIAPLPPYNSSDPFIGLVSVSGVNYLVSQYHLYKVMSLNNLGE